MALSRFAHISSMIAIDLNEAVKRDLPRVYGIPVDIYGSPLEKKVRVFCTRNMNLAYLMDWQEICLSYRDNLK